MQDDLTLVVTGAAGFIGANLVRALNARGHTRIVAVDDLTDGDKIANLTDCEISDFLDRDEFLARLAEQAHLELMNAFVADDNTNEEE